MICKNCGSYITDGLSFCPQCGQSVEADTPQTKAQPEPPQNNYQPEPPQNNYQPEPPQNNYQPDPAPYNSQYYQPNSYQQPAPNNYAQPYAEQEYPVSTGRWIGVFFLTAIPLVGFIMLLVWAFGGTGYTSLKNYARANLILALILILLTVIISLISSLVMGVSFTALFSGLSSY